MTIIEASESGLSLKKDGKRLLALITCRACGSLKWKRVDQMKDVSDQYCSPKCYRANKRVEIYCKVCNSKIEIHKCKIGQVTTCSKECSRIGKQNRRDFKCLHCGKDDFYPLSQDKYYKGNGKFCSKKCRYAYYQDHPETTPQYKTGKSIDGAGYIVYSHTKTREHRAVMEALLGRKLHSKEIVHHIDGDKANNSPSNLLLLSHSEHSKLHYHELLIGPDKRFLPTKNLKTIGYVKEKEL